MLILLPRGPILVEKVGRCVEELIRRFRDMLEVKHDDDGDHRIRDIIRERDEMSRIGLHWKGESVIACLHV